MVGSKRTHYDLRKATEDGDLNLVRRLIAEGANPNAGSAFGGGLTAYEEAIESRDVRFFDALAASRYSPFDDYSEPGSSGALAWAESSSSKPFLVKVVRSLKRRGWLEQPGGRYIPVKLLPPKAARLLAAVARDYVQSASKLIASGVDVRVADSSADNLFLCRAARKSSVRMAQLLLDAGAPLTCGVLEEALDALRPEMVAFLLDRPIQMIRPLLNTVNNNRFEVILCHAALDAGGRSAKQQAERCGHLLAKMRPDLLANPAARYDIRKLVKGGDPEAWVGTLAECLRHKVGSEPLTPEESAVLAIRDLDDAIHHDGLQAILPQYPATTIFEAAEASGMLGVPRVAAAIGAIARHLRRAGLRPNAPRLAERLEDLWEADQAAVHRLEATYFEARRRENLGEALAAYVRARADRFPG